MFSLKISLPFILFIAFLIVFGSNFIKKPVVQLKNITELIHIDIVKFEEQDTKKLFGFNYYLSPSLRFVSGCVLTSDKRFFGGWSGLAWNYKKKSLVAISDTGLWTEFISPEEICNMESIESEIGWLVNTKHQTLRSIGYGDLESIAIDTDNTWLISHESYSSGLFESSKRSVESLKSAQFELINVPDDLHNLPKGRGIEASTWINDGKGPSKILALAERSPKGASYTPGWILDHSGNLIGDFKYSPSLGFDVSDVVYSKECGFYILERKLNWQGRFIVKIKLIKHLDLDNIEFSLFSQKLIFSGDSSGLAVDNLEGIAVHSVGGTCHIHLISDSNFLPFEKNILLNFELKENE